MCYKLPGPRCTNHAKKILNRALIAHMKDPENFDKYVEYRDALRQYDMTPGGQQAISALIEKETDVVKKYNLFQRLQDVKRLRAEAIAAIGAEDIGDTYDIEKAAGEKDIVETSQPPQDPFANVPPITERIELSPYLHYDYDSYSCGEPGGCSEDYCHEAVFENLRLANYTAEEFLQNVFALRDKKPPVEWVSRMNEIGYKSHIILEPRSGYYGEEAFISFSPELTKELNDLFYSMPNAVEETGALVYAREEGIDTAGLEPLEAAKATLKTSNRRRTADLDKTINGAQNVGKRKINIEKIIYDSAAIAELQGYDMSAEKSSKPGGVVCLTPDGKCILVGGEKRFKGILESGKKYWTFITLY